MHAAVGLDRQRLEQAFEQDAALAGGREHLDVELRAVRPAAIQVSLGHEAVAEDHLLVTRPFADPAPKRRIALAWRSSFPRPEAVAALRAAILACPLRCVTMLDNLPQTAKS